MYLSYSRAPSKSSVAAYLPGQFYVVITGRFASSEGWATLVAMCRTAFQFGVTILAAGQSIRMGRPKLQLPWRDTTVIGHQIRNWSELGARQVAVVCRPNDDGISGELDRLRFSARDRIPNPEAGQGMFSSIRCAARWSGWQSDITHVAISLGDQPHLRRETLKRLLEFCAARSDNICQPQWQGRTRHPVILPRAIFLRLAQTEFSTLKDFLVRYAIATCECDDPGLEIDLDTPADYERAKVHFEPAT